MAKILLVEDNEQNRDMLVRRLQRKGHLVVTAGDGERAASLAGRVSGDSTVAYAIAFAQAENPDDLTVSAEAPPVAQVDEGNVPENVIIITAREALTAYAFAVDARLAQSSIHQS